MSRARSFVFTLNNYTAAHEASIKSACDDGKYRYLIYGREIAPTTGTPHLQGYFQLINPRSTTAILRQLEHFGLPPGTHIESARGTPQQNIDYCSKAGDIYTYGMAVNQGKRSDLQEVCDSIKEGATIEDIKDSFPIEYVKYHRGLSMLAASRSVSRTAKSKVIWCYGPTGSGKTRWAFQQHPTSYWKDVTTKWWDGFSTQESVIFDDYRPTKEVPFNMLLRLFDRYPVQVEVKGGYVNFNPKTIIVTSPRNPVDMFSQLDWLKEEDLKQIYRRIDEVREFPLNVVVDNWH